MDFLQFISKLKQRTIKPKMYAVVLQYGNQQKLHICAAYSLDDAWVDAKKTLSKELNGVLPSAMTVVMWASRDLNDLFSEFMDERVVPVTSPGDTKTDLMKRIVDTKDSKLFEESRHLFSEYELKYLEEKLDIKK